MAIQNQPFIDLVKNVRRGVHAACLYPDDSTLIQALAEFLEAGFALNEVAVVIVTRANRAALEKTLASRGHDVPALKASGRYAAFDAAETLGLFMREGKPDRMLFTSLVHPLFCEFARRGSGVRGYGEMVTVLWQEGNIQGAAELESLGSELGQEIAKLTPLTLLCAYPNSLARRSGFENAKAGVHREHPVVIEPEDGVAGL
jgi:hypothetical protein